jgi:hypothetical protein
MTRVRHVIKDTKHYVCGAVRECGGMYFGSLLDIVIKGRLQVEYDKYDDVCLDCVQQTVCKLKDYKAKKEKEQ